MKVFGGRRDAGAAARLTELKLSPACETKEDGLEKETWRRVKVDVEHI